MRRHRHSAESRLASLRLHDTLNPQDPRLGRDPRPRQRLSLGWLARNRRQSSRRVRSAARLTATATLRACPAATQSTAACRARWPPAQPCASSTTTRALRQPPVPLRTPPRPAVPQTASVSICIPSPRTPVCARRHHHQGAGKAAAIGARTTSHPAERLRTLKEARKRTHAKFSKDVVGSHSAATAAASAGCRTTDVHHARSGAAHPQQEGGGTR